MPTLSSNPLLSLLVAATGGTIVPSDVAPKPVLISVVAMDIMPCGSDCLLTGRGELAEAPTKFTVVATRNVGADGADIVVGKTGSPIDDMVVHIPPGAMEVMDHISLGYSTRPVQVRAGRGAGVVVVLRAHKIQWFKQPVSIEVHFHSSPRPSLVVPYRIDANDGLHVMQLSRLDLNHDEFRFDTFSPGEFTWIYP